MNRRDLLKGVAGLTAGLLLPSTVVDASGTTHWTESGGGQLADAHGWGTLNLFFGHPSPWVIDFEEDWFVVNQQTGKRYVYANRGDSLSLNFLVDIPDAPLVATLKPVQNEAAGTYVHVLHSGELLEANDLARLMLRFKQPHDADANVPVIDALSIEDLCWRAHEAMVQHAWSKMH